MKVMVCVKRVPMTQEVDLKIDASGKVIDKSRLSYLMNEWDSYAIEEAVLIKEELGGTVTVITVGEKADEEILTKCMAMGADRAVRIDPGDCSMDGSAVSRSLAEFIKQNEYDLVLTGVQSEDMNDGVVGIMLAEHLGAAHAAVVNGLDIINNESIKVSVELEGGINEVSNLALPAVLSIQSGINHPRYVSIMAVRKASKKKREVITFADLNLTEADLARQTVLEEIFPPPETKGAEMIEGAPGDVADQIIRIMKEKGVIE
jgi:electron transfer flavoprotein beta subunit